LAALCPRTCTALLKLFDHAIEIGITCAKLLCEPVAATLGNYFAVRDYLELTRLTRRKHGINSQSLFDEGHETRDLNLVVLSRWTVNDFDFHSGLQAPNRDFRFDLPDRHTYTPRALLRKPIAFRRTLFHLGAGGPPFIRLE